MFGLRQRPTDLVQAVLFQSTIGQQIITKGGKISLSGSGSALSGTWKIFIVFTPKRNAEKMAHFRKNIENFKGSRCVHIRSAEQMEHFTVSKYKTWSVLKRSETYVWFL